MSLLYIPQHLRQPTAAFLASRAAATAPPRYDWLHGVTRRQRCWRLMPVGVYCSGPSCCTQVALLMSGRVTCIAVLLPQIPETGPMNTGQAWRELWLQRECRSRGTRSHSLAQILQDHVTGLNSRSHFTISTDQDLRLHTLSNIDRSLLHAGEVSSVSSHPTKTSSVLTWAILSPVALLWHC